MNIHVPVFCVDMSLHFSDINVEECNCWIIWRMHVLFYKKQSSYFRGGVNSYILIKNMCDPVSPHPCQHSALLLLFNLNILISA